MNFSISNSYVGLVIGEKVEEDIAIGTIETDDGPLDIHSPVEGTVIEVNAQVLEDPSQTFPLLTPMGRLGRMSNHED